MENVRIAIRDSTDTVTLGFFDNQSGIRFKSADLHTFLAGNCAYLSLEYFSKDINKVRSGCHLAFRYKGNDYWLTIMDVQKASFKVTLTAYSLNLEANNETRGPYQAPQAMSMLQYIRYYDPERSFSIGVNEVSEKLLKLEWSGSDSVLARLYSVANSFGAEIEFITQLNNDYSLKSHILNIYKVGNMGKLLSGQPIRVGKSLKVINFTENIKKLHSSATAVGKDGLTIAGYNQKVYDSRGRLQFYSENGSVYAPQTRERFPSVGKKSSDNWNLIDLGTTEYSTKESLYGYILSELKKVCEPEVTYKTEGYIDGDVGDAKTLIDDVHYSPPLYVQARISEKTESLVSGRTSAMTFTNFKRQSAAVANDLLKRVAALAQEAAPYVISLATENGTVFKNSKGSSLVKASLKKGQQPVVAQWKFLKGETVVSETSTYTVEGSQFKGTLNLIVVASVDGTEVAREYLSFINAEDGVGISNIKRYFTVSDQSKDLTESGNNWSQNPSAMTKEEKFLWSYDEVEYTDGHVTKTEPAVIGIRGDDGDSADQAIKDAVEAYKAQLAQLSNSVDTVQKSLISQSDTIKAQASLQDELKQRTTAIEETADGTKKIIQDLTKTVDETTGDIQTVTETVKKTQDSLSGLTTNLSALTTKTDNIILNQASFEETLKSRVVALSESQSTLEGKVMQTSALLKQTTDNITASISSLENSTVKSTELNLDNNGFVTKVGKIIDGQTMATMIAQDESSVRIVAEKMKLTGDMVVGGTLDASKVNVTNLNANKIEGLDATFLTAKLENAIINLLDGKIIHSKRYETIINLDTGNILFQNGKPSIQGILPGAPVQFITFDRGVLTDTRNHSVTSIGSTTDNIVNADGSGFAGLQIWNGKPANATSLASSIHLKANLTTISRKFASSTSDALQIGWMFSGESGSLLTPYAAGFSGELEKQVKQRSRIFVGDIYLLASDGSNISLMTILKTFSQNQGHLANITGRHDIIKWFPEIANNNKYAGVNRI